MWPVNSCHVGAGAVRHSRVRGDQRALPMPTSRYDLAAPARRALRASSRNAAIPDVCGPWLVRRNRPFVHATYAGPPIARCGSRIVCARPSIPPTARCLRARSVRDPHRHSPPTRAVRRNSGRPPMSKPARAPFHNHRGSNSADRPAARTVSGLWDLIGRLVDLFEPAECANCFSSCGYDPD